MKEKICISCNRKITNTRGTTDFICPSCEKNVITRCSNCRKLGARYRCKECGFEGPN